MGVSSTIKLVLAILVGTGSINGYQAGLIMQELNNKYSGFPISDIPDYEVSEIVARIVRK